MERRFVIIWNCQFIFCPRVQRPHIDICAAIMLPVLFTYLQLRFRIIHWCNDHISLFPIRHLQFRFAFVFRVDILVSWQLWSLYGSGFIASVWTVEHHSYFKRMTHTHTHRTWWYDRSIVYMLDYIQCLKTHCKWAEARAWAWARLWNCRLSASRQMQFTINTHHKLLHRIYIYISTWSPFLLCHLGFSTIVFFSFH